MLRRALSKVVKISSSFSCIARKKKSCPVVCLSGHRDCAMSRSGSSTSPLTLGFKSKCYAVLRVAAFPVFFEIGMLSTDNACSAETSVTSLTSSTKRGHHQRGLVYRIDLSLRRCCHGRQVRCPTLSSVCRLSTIGNSTLQWCHLTSDVARYVRNRSLIIPLTFMSGRRPNISVTRLRDHHWRLNPNASQKRPRMILRRSKICIPILQHCDEAKLEPVEGREKISQLPAARLAGRLRKPMALLTMSLEQQQVMTMREYEPMSTDLSRNVGRRAHLLQVPHCL
jgi:hypothetical protein